jgi:hypothetical protein
MALYSAPFILWKGTSNEMAYKERARLQINKRDGEGSSFYWVKQEGAFHFVAGYYGFGRDIQFQGLTFRTAGEAKNYCAVKDAQTLVIEEVREKEKAQA